MSILQEYEMIQNGLTDEEIKNIDHYLEFYPNKVLSDLYYNEDEWKQFEKWCENTDQVVRENAPIIFVIENYKGIAEHNFIGTKDEIAAQLNLTLNELQQNLEKDEDICIRPNITYMLHVCQSIEDLEQCLSGEYNDDLEDMINRNYQNHEDYNGCYNDWYWDNQLDMCGPKAMDIAKSYALSSYEKIVEHKLKDLGPFDFEKRKAVDVKLQSSILQELGLTEVKRHSYSVTQGEAEVLIDGKSIVRYGDDKWLHQKDGTYTNGFRTLKADEVSFFQEYSSGWGSIQSDEHLIHAALRQFPEKVIEAIKKESISLDEKISKFDEKKNSINNKKENNIQNKLPEKELFD